MRFFCYFLCLFACLASRPAVAILASESPGAHPLHPGDAFPDIAFAGDLLPGQAGYLGLEGVETPTLYSLQAETVIFVVYSMYCPHCQAEAPVLVDLFEQIRERGLEESIKIIGLAAGNSQTEVDVFRDKYGIPFPLIPDPDYSAHTAAGSVGTPFFYVLERWNGVYAVRFQHLGRLDSLPEFLDQLPD